jgi:hypothetical protein
MKNDFENIFLSKIVLFICILISSAIYSQEKDVLVKIGDKTITSNEFIRRAEYTLRPSYCKGNTNLEKKIVLNSLIAEKMLAIEAGGNNSFITSPQVETFLLGRKEQIMRLFLYNDEVRNKVKVDSDKVKKAFKYAGREYKISYISLTDSLVVKQLENELLKEKRPFEKVLHENYNLKEIPEKKVAWNKIEHPLILDSLFTKKHNVGDIVGPIKIEDNYQMFLKINGWTNNSAITEQHISNRYNTVKNTYEEIELYKAYVDYVRQIMRGKKLKFNKDIFSNFADLMGPIYMKDKKEQENIFEEGVWNYKNDEIKLQNAKPDLDQIKDKALFSFDNKDWTVDDFLKEIKKHPLVFREKKFSKEKFGEQLQLAILDVIRDKCLTEKAYEKGYDTLPDVVHEIMMWEDNLNGLYEKERLLKKAGVDSLFSTNYQKVVDETLNPIVDSLQKKYSDEIIINTKILNSIKLTRTNMVVSYTNFPFAQAVPNFPLITTDNKLDYGKAVSLELKK